MIMLKDRSLIDQFFAALLSNDVSRCENLSHQIENLAKNEQAYRPWSKYIRGVLLRITNQEWDRAEQIFRKLLEDTTIEPFLRGQVQLSLGSLFYRKGLWEEVIATCEQALALFTDLDEPSEKVKAWQLIAYASNDGYQQGALDEQAVQTSLDCSLKVIDTVQAMGAENNPDLISPYAMAWLTLGGVQNMANDWPNAIESLTKSSELTKQLGNRYLELFANAHLADAHLASAMEELAAEVPRPESVASVHLENALNASQAALGISKEFNDSYQQFWLYDQLGYIHRIAKRYERAIDCYKMAFPLIEELMEDVGAGKAKSDLISTVTEVYANAVLTCVEAGDNETAFFFTEQARARIFLELLTSKDAKSSTDTPALTDTPADGVKNTVAGHQVMDVRTLQSSLPIGFMVLAYYTTGVIESLIARQDRANEYRRIRFPEEQVLIFAITRENFDVIKTDLDPNQIYVDTSSKTIAENFLRDGMRKYLYNRLLLPVQDLIDKQSRVAICPHGPLHHVPFHALSNGQDMALMNVDGPDLVYVPSATVLLHRRDKIADNRRDAQESRTDIHKPSLSEPHPPNDSCLTVGYNAQDVTDSGSLVDEGILEHAEQEAEMIACITGGIALVGPELKKERFYALASEFLYIHFSCHGTFVPDEPMESALYIGPGESLTAREVSEMEGLNCRLVTLSACETGRSRISRGDELYGLARAFFQAGAAAVIATMWQVDERTTLILAEEFVKQIRTGASAATALKNSQMALRHLKQSEIKAKLKKYQDETDLLVQAKDGNSREPEDAAPSTINGVRPPLELLLENGQPDDAVLEKYPYFWAPYILIRDPDL